jgi:thiol-disulfide isomerase/thioredoxin
MKKVLALIGAFFARIWAWIKETAWVQPLLIVGVIFAVIFSIPAITSWIQGLAENANSALTYYRKHQKSMVNAEESDAQKLVDAMLEESNQYGDKFFLLFVDENCPFCKDLQPTIEELSKNLRRYNVDIDSEGAFKFYTIFVDEEYETTETTTPWKDFVTENALFFERASEVFANSWFYTTFESSQADSYAGDINDGETLPRPTLFLYDLLLPEDAPDRGISEIVIGGVPGGTSFERAEFLADAWTHRGDFAPPTL